MYLISLSVASDSPRLWKKEVRRVLSSQNDMIEMGGSEREKIISVTRLVLARFRYRTRKKVGNRML